MHTLLSRLLNSRGCQPGEANYLTDGEMVGIVARIHQEIGELENNNKLLLEACKAINENELANFSVGLDNDMRLVKAAIAAGEGE